LKTSAFVQQKLQGWGIPFDIKATTGVVGLIKGNNPDKRIIALRADMDALPIVEENNVDYKSQYNGVMHACGHDVHTTCLLGAAKILNELKGEWEGTVKLIFQPGEEKKSWWCKFADKRRCTGKPQAFGNICIARTPRNRSRQIEFQRWDDHGKCR